MLGAAAACRDCRPLVGRLDGALGYPERPGGGGGGTGNAPQPLWRNTSGDGLWVGFTLEALDPHGPVSAVLNTPVQETGPRETKTLSSGGPTAGPSEIPCSRVARPRVPEPAPRDLRSSELSSGVASAMTPATSAQARAVRDNPSRRALRAPHAGPRRSRACGGRRSRSDRAARGAVGAGAPSRRGRSGRSIRSRDESDQGSSSAARRARSPRGARIVRRRGPTRPARSRRWGSPNRGSQW